MKQGFFFLFLILPLSLWAQGHQEVIELPTKSGESKSTETRGRIETLSNSPSLSAPGSNKNMLLEDPDFRWKNLEPSEKSVAAKMLLFWSLTNQEEVTPQILSDAGISPEKLKEIKAQLGKKNQLSLNERKILREPFTDGQIQNRIQSRNKILKYVSDLQSISPEFNTLLPEMLTVWGEARGIKGFFAEDDLIQEARMATIIHVLRNRTLKRMAKLQKMGKNPNENQEKWKVATSRFQFSAFEPYDPNLSELSLGPSKKGKTWRLGSLPPNDRRALINLARVIVKLNSGLIKIPDPLGQNNTRHYLTPDLIPYSKKREKNLKFGWQSNGRFHVLRIPSQAPEFLAIVPKWALQNKLISSPPILISTPEKQDASEVKIPPQDFIYFWGIL
jgi:hypothetical protein